MSNDDEAARVERARRIRRQVESLVNPEEDPGAPEPSAEHESPRDFIHRRMRETKEECGEDSGSE